MDIEVNDMDYEYLAMISYFGILNDIRLELCLSCMRREQCAGRIVCYQLLRMFEALSRCN